MHAKNGVSPRHDNKLPIFNNIGAIMVRKSKQVYFGKTYTFTKHAFYKTYGKAFDDKLNANELIKNAIDNKVLIQIGDDAFVINPFFK